MSSLLSRLAQTMLVAGRNPLHPRSTSTRLLMCMAGLDIIP